MFSFTLQFIDHFDYTNNDIFNQKYLISGECYTTLLYNRNVSHFRYIPSK